MAEKEFIERKSLYDFCKDQIEEETGAYSKGRNAGLRVAMSAVMNKDAIPAADVRPVVHGKWICGDYWSEGCGMGESYGFYYKCSVCKDVVQGGYKDCGMKYCPNCGADMRPQPPKEETT